MALFGFNGLKSLLLLGFGVFESGDRSRTIQFKDFADFARLARDILVIIEGRSRKCSLKTRYSRGSGRGRSQNQNIPMRD